ncbi:NAD(P)-binding protein [Vulgatibacter incomptus]|uniref:Neurosporene desaturase n=1 Tax=Vulgatibacter incomptus TaxID=1391653 RepID=A0A0K1P9S5_9BACT|nr:NAD(P)-binding protein [Vulgatibacter incomptus]AKU89864.1 Neurosporene desaturase [Vulgatibacter incomptus]
MSGSRRPTQLYDAIVLGSELPGLVAGALLAKRNLRVLVVDDGGPYDHHEAGGFRLPQRPTILPTPKAAPALHALLDELGAIPAWSRSARPLAEGLQLFLPRARLELRPSRDARVASLVRAFGPDGEAQARSLDLAADGMATLDRLLAGRLPPDGWLERRSHARLAARCEKELTELPIDRSHPVGEALLGLHGFASNLAGDASPTGFLRATMPLLSEACRLPGHGLASLLRAFIASHRGDFAGEPGAPAIAEELVVERGGVSGVRLAGFSEPHRGRICFAATDLDRISSLLASSRAQRKLVRQAGLVSAPQRLVVSNLVVAKDAIPPGLGELVLVSGFGRPALVELDVARKANGAIDEGLRTVTAASLAPADQAEEASGARLDAILEEVLPFHERHVRFRARPPRSEARVELTSDGTTALSGLPLRSSIDRLLVANRSVLPGLGLEGELLVGTRLARLAEEQIRKIRPS